MKKKKKLLIVQIDGLSCDRLGRAMKNGYMPTLKKLVDSGGYKPVRFRTGIPSTTPFAQAGILYGDNFNIPSFTWFDKKTGVIIRFGGLNNI